MQYISPTCILYTSKIRHSLFTIHGIYYICTSRARTHTPLCNALTIQNFMGRLLFFHTYNTETRFKKRYFHRREHHCLYEKPSSLINIFRVFCMCPDFWRHCVVIKNIIKTQQKLVLSKFKTIQ